MSWKPSPSFQRLLLLLAIFSLAPITLYILYTRTGGLASARELTFQRNMRFAFMAGTDELNLPPLTDWEWEKVCALDSGVSSDELNQIVGFNYGLYGELHWIARPDYWTLFFVDRAREASWGIAQPAVAIRIPRKDLAELKLPEGAKGTCVARDVHPRVTRHPAITGVTPVTVDFTLGFAQ